MMVGHYLIHAEKCEKDLKREFKNGNTRMLVFP